MLLQRDNYNKGSGRAAAAVIIMIEILLLFAIILTARILIHVAITIPWHGI